MKHYLLLLSMVVVSTTSLFSQCITQVDFTPWVVGESPAQGNWQLVGGGTGVDQLINAGNPTTFISPYDLINVEITGTFRSDDSDDDWLGFVFGYQSPIGSGSNYNTWLFDWKKADQSTNCGCNAFGFNCDENPRGMSLIRVNGNIPATGGACGTPNAWYFNNHRDSPPVFDIVGGPTGGGWNQSFDHQFRLIYTSTQATIFIDGTQRFNITGCFEPGRFGFYNLSQSLSRYRNFQYTLLVDFDVATPTVCVAEPAQFEFTNPNCGGNFNLQLISSMEWDYGDGNTFTNSSPTAANINPTHAYSAPGTYNVTLSITDQNGCTTSETNTITVVPSPIADFTTDEGCFPSPTTFTNNSTGTISTYAWSFGDGTTSAAQNPPPKNYPAGTYQVILTVADAGGCSTSDTVSVEVLSNLTGTIAVTDAGCPGVNNGALDLTVNNGISPYSFIWDNNSTNEDLMNLAPGSYTASFTDANGCTGTESATVGVGAPPTATSLVADETCAGLANGGIDLSVSGPAASYNFIWSNNDVTEDLTGVAAGTYTVTFSDANGCSGTHTATVGLLPSYTANMVLDTYIGGDNVSCNGAADGAIDLTVNGTTGPFTFVWSNNTFTEDISGLTASSYSVTIADTNGCQQILDTVLTEPAVISATAMPNPISCFGGSDGSIDLTVTGGSGNYTYSWSNSSTDEDPQNLPLNTYSVIITDENGCTDNSVTVTITEPATPVSVIATPTNPNCFGENDGRALAVAAGGTGPYTFSWSSGDMDSIAIALSAGTYNVTATDANGCTATTVTSLVDPDPITVSIAQPDTIVFGDSVELVSTVVATGSDTLLYSWAPNNTLTCADCPNPTAFNVWTQDYELTVIDENGCDELATVTVNVLNDKVFYVPNAFSPNGDGYNDYFEIFAEGVRYVEAGIYDRWGEKIYSFGDVTSKWDGTFKGKPVRPGVYLYTVKVYYIDGDTRQQNGSLVVLR